ncbi:hypothetical protein [Vibrio alginolyticus]|nr:hypothetical protein [Vibrio alginolyticus]
MDKSAIQQIQESANTPQFLKQLEKAGFPVPPYLSPSVCMT